MRQRLVRSTVLDGESSLASRFRGQRFDRLLAAVPDLADATVVDLGGTATFWHRAPARPAHVVVVNLESQPTDLPPWIEARHGDACDTTAVLGDRRFDLVFSNSVIEHVGGHDRRLRFAENVERLAPRHWIQTPNRWFPLEPHFLGPWFQHLPVPARARVLRRWPLVHTPPVDLHGALEIALETELIGATELRYYFPDSTIEREKVAGLTKSLIAHR